MTTCNPGGGKPSSPTCNSSSVTGVGIQSAGKVFYGGMLLKTSGMTYKRYRTTTLTAAKNLDASCVLFDRLRTPGADRCPRRGRHPSRPCTGHTSP